MKKNKKVVKIRQFEIVQYEKNPRTGEDLNFDEDKIKEGLNHKSIKRWVYVRHDKDTWKSNDDFVLSCEKNEGELREAHWHIFGQCQPAIDIEILAKWFGVPVNQIEFKSGAGAFEDMCEYFTHENEKQQALGKHRYSDDELKSNVPNWRELVNRRFVNKVKYGKSDPTPKEMMRHAVLEEGKTLRECNAENPLLYAEDIEKLRKLRLEYLAKAPLPPVRLNYYIEGKGGMGKDTLSQILAKALVKDKEYEFDEDIYFQVGSSGALFEGYDGQPIVIWSDRRAAALLKELGGRGNVFNVFDTIPKRSRQNVKFSSASLINAVNIVNGVESYQDFLDALAGEYKDKFGQQYEAEDKNQSRRRFPLIICLHEDDFDLLINRGFAEGTFEYESYLAYKHIRGNFGNVCKFLDNKIGEPILISMTEPIVKNHNILEAKIKDNKIKDAEKVPVEFQKYGKQNNDIYIFDYEFNDPTYELDLFNNMKGYCVNFVKKQYIGTLTEFDDVLQQERNYLENKHKGRVEIVINYDKRLVEERE